MIGNILDKAAWNLGRALGKGRWLLNHHTKKGGDPRMLHAWLAREFSPDDADAILHRFSMLDVCTCGVERRTLKHAGWCPVTKRQMDGRTFDTKELMEAWR